MIVRSDTSPKTFLAVAHHGLNTEEPLQTVSAKWDVEMRLYAAPNDHPCVDIV